MKAQPEKKIRVLHIITRMIIGGAQENTLFTVEGLQQDGRFEAVLATGPALGPEGSLLKRAEAKGVNLAFIPEMRREINPIRDLVTLSKLYRLIKEGNYAVVHTHSAKAGILGRLAARLAGTPVIIHTMHGLPFNPYQNRVLNFLYVNIERLAAHWCDYFVSVSKTMAAEMAETGICAPEKVGVIYSGIELEKFRPGASGTEARKRLGIAEDEPVVGKIARLFYLKGHEHLLRAAREVKKEIPRVKFLLVGDGILRSRLQREAEKLGLAGNVLFTGLAEPEDIPELVSAMDVLVHVSFREGLPKAVVQGFALGKPAVTFAVDGAPEVVIAGKTGHLVTPKDAKKLADGIIDLLKDRKKAKLWGEEGRRLVEEKFDVADMIRRIIDLYLELLRRKKSQ